LPASVGQSYIDRSKLDLFGRLLDCVEGLIERVGEPKFNDYRAVDTMLPINDPVWKDTAMAELKFIKSNSRQQHIHNVIPFAMTAHNPLLIWSFVSGPAGKGNCLLIRALWPFCLTKNIHFLIIAAQRIAPSLIKS
jgi:hypothetical protein